MSRDPHAPPPSRDKVARLRRLREIARRHGGRCLAEQYVRGTESMEFECRRKHRWQAYPQRIFRGNWCPVCRKAGAEERAWVPHTSVPMPDRTDPAACLHALRAVARERGGRCVSRSLRDQQDRFEFVCARGHQWRSRVAMVLRNGTWCRRCAAMNPEGDAALRKLVADRGGQLLSPSYLGTGVSHDFACEHGHRWSACPNNIKRGSWCPTCALERRGPSARRETKILGVVQALAVERGGRCLETVRPSPGTRWRFRCAVGHRWQASAQAIFRGEWCPRCGPGKPDLLAGLRAFARARGGECLDTVTPSRRTGPRMRCSNGHEWLASFSALYQGSWCPRCAGRSVTITDMQQLAANLGGRCLSTKYTRSENRLRWACAAGHEFRLLPHQVREGSWCRICDFLTGTLGKALECARKKGGALVGKSESVRRTPLKWRCAAGHTWLAPAQRVAAGHWCPSCADTRLTIEEMQRVAQRNLGRCLSQVYVNTQTKLLWECQEGHQWWALPNNIRNLGRWCPTCGHREGGAKRRADAKDRR